MEKHDLVIGVLPNYRSLDIIADSQGVNRSRGCHKYSSLSNQNASSTIDEWFPPIENHKAQEGRVTLDHLHYRQILSGATHPFGE